MGKRESTELPPSQCMRFLKQTSPPRFNFSRILFTCARDDYLI